MANTKITSRVIADNSVGIDALNVTDGTNGQALVTDGSGGLSFASVGVSGIDSSADATAITIDSSEKVGLNKVPSTWHLDVLSSDAYVASFEGSNDTGVLINSDTGSGDIIGYSNSTSTYNPLNIRAATGTGLVIDTSNNVGIGAAPQTAPYYNNDNPVLTVHKASGNAILPIVAAANTSSAILHLNQSGNRYWRISAINADAALTFSGKQPGSGAGETENVRISTKGLSLGDTDGDYVSRNNTGGLHVKRGGILMNGPPGDANMSSAAADNCWTYHGQGGRGGSFTGLTISVPNPNNGASGVGYGGFSLEFYIAGYNAKYHSGHFSGYVNGGITLSKRAFWDSSGSGTLSSGSVGSQGFYLTIGFPSMTHPTCKFVINKGGHGVSGPYTNMSGVSITWT